VRPKTGQRPAKVSKWSEFEANSSPNRVCLSEISSGETRSGGSTLDGGFFRASLTFKPTGVLSSRLLHLGLECALCYPRFGSWTRPSEPSWGGLARRDDAAGSCQQGGATPPAPPPPGRLNRVRSALTQMVKCVVVKKVNVHKTLQRKTSGQLPNLGLFL